MSNMAVIPTVVCDMCGKPGQAWRVQCVPDPAWQIDLCVAHAEPFRKLQAKSAVRDSRPARRTGIRKTRVLGDGPE